MTEPIPFKTTRYRCPFCPRTAANGTRMREHIGRCWLNPAARSCKTCINYEGYTDACGCEPGCNWGGPAEGNLEHCRAGVDLRGDGAEIKPGPIVHCGTWEPES